MHKRPHLFVYLTTAQNSRCSWDASFCTVTELRNGGPRVRISIRCQERHFSVLQIVQMALRTIRPLATVCRVTAWKESGRSVKLNLVLRLQMHGDIPPLPSIILWSVVNSARIQLFLYFYQGHVVNLGSIFKNRTRLGQTCTLSKTQWLLEFCII